MIRYALICVEDHEFEAWFAGSSAFERQQDDRAIACPVCGSAEVRKLLMAPALAGSLRKESVPLAANVPAEPDAVEMLRKLRKRLTESADYVGKKFAEEARKIHYNEVEKRGIYGEATSDEARALLEEGVAFQPLPTLPEELN